MIGTLSAPCEHCQERHTLCHSTCGKYLAYRAKMDDISKQRMQAQALNEADVIEITSIDGKEKYTEAVSDRDADFVYKVGEMVSVDDFCENRWEECAAGIHFFMNRKEAVDYWL